MRKLLLSLSIILALELGTLAFEDRAVAQSADGNLSGTLLTLAIRTSTSPIVSGDRVNDRWRGGHIIINIGTYTSGTFTPTIQGKDPVSGNYYTILAGNGLSSTGVVVMRVFPGITAVANSAAADVLPRTWRFQMVGTATPNASYSVGFQLVE